MNYGLKIDLITNYIKANRMTRKEFCKQCNISLSTFYKIMRGKNCRLSALWKISRVMHLQIYELIQAN